MTIELLTPVNTRKGEIVDLARKRFRKQVLPLTEIVYGGQKKTFDLAYMHKIKAAYDAGAFTYIPVKLAGGDNKHTDDVLRTGGRLVGLSVSEQDGLVADLELNDAGIKAVQDSDGEIPVSAKIWENLTRTDGAGGKYDAALAHVLLTDDPFVRGMTPWKELDEVALSENRADNITETIDLSAEHFGDPEESMSDEKKVTLSVTEAQAARLIKLAKEDEELEALDLKPEDVEADVTHDPAAGERTLPGDRPESGERAPGVGPEDEDDEDGEEGVKLSRQSSEAIELARTEAAAANATANAAVLELRRERIDREIEGLAAKGLAPSILALARPLFDQPQALELSRGGKVEKTDSAAIMRNVLAEVVELARKGEDVLDLEKLSGVLMDDEETMNTRTEAQLTALSRTFD